MSTQDRPIRLAIIATTWFRNSHADVLAGPLMVGWLESDQHVRPAEVRSLYLLQRGDHQGPNGPRPDIGEQFARRHGVRLVGSVRESLLEDDRLAVDGVVIIAEHGDYDRNEFEQKLYPRRELFDQVLDVFEEQGRIVPVFLDKHLSAASTDAEAMVERAQRLGVPLLAGSSLPLCWREPRDQRWPWGKRLERLAVVGSGPSEDYGFHLLELAQAEAERREGGPTGIRRVKGLRGAAAATRLAQPEWAGLLRGLANRANVDGVEELVDAAEVFQLTCDDGLQVLAINAPAAEGTWALAAEGDGLLVSHRIEVGDEPNFEHFLLLADQIVRLVRTGAAGSPLHRTLTTTLVLEKAMRSRFADGDTQEIPIIPNYAGVEAVPGEQCHLPRSSGPRRLPTPMDPLA